MSHQPQTGNLGKARTKGKPPLRKCIVSGAARPKTEMFRFVIGPDGKVVPDLVERLPGRGLWLSAERDMVNTACAKGLFAKAARRMVKVPADLEEALEGLMVRRCLDLIGLARRAGDVVQGFEKARARFRSGKGGVLLQASDGLLLFRSANYPKRPRPNGSGPITKIAQKCSSKPSLACAKDEQNMSWRLRVTDRNSPCHP